MSFFLYQILTVPKIWHRILLRDSVVCFVNGNFCFTRSQQLIPVEKSLYLVKTDFASVQVRRVRGLEKKIYSIFTKKVPQGSFCESPVMKWTVIYDNSITPFKENRTTPPRYFHSFLKENQEFVTVGSAFEYIYKIDSQTGMQKIYCKSCIGCRSLDLKGGSPGYWIFVSSVHCSFCNTCLVEKVDCTDNQITDLIEKEVRTGFDLCCSTFRRNRMNFLFCHQ